MDKPISMPEGCRIFPSSFDPNDPKLHALPRPADWRWNSCEDALKSAGSRGVMMRLPVFWQIGLPLADICRTLGIPLFINEPENIPVGAMALKIGGIDTVVTENKDAAAFAEYLVKRALPYPKLGILIHRVDDAWEVPRVVLETWGAVVQEVHAFPGVPVLVQCAALSAKKIPRFHFSDEYTGEMDGTETLITSAESDPLPLSRYKLPCSLKKTGTCSCGKDIFECLI